MKIFRITQKKLDERCTHIAFSYLTCGWSFHNDSSYKNQAVVSMEKAAEILEYLYAFSGCEKKYTEYYRLICSLGYFISFQYSKAFVVFGKTTSDTFISKLTKLFFDKKIIVS